MDRDAKIYVAGHRGMVGSAIARKLSSLGYTNVVTRTHAEVDLVSQQAVMDFLGQEKPDYIFMAAAKVGGIHANNTLRAEFLYQNLMIETNVVHAAWQAGVNRMLFLGSSCIYPRDCPQPIREDYLLTGPLEQTNEPYAIAKIAGVKLCESYNRQYGTQYVSAMPTNLYGPNDSYDLNNSHVLPALIRKTHEAKLRGDRELVVWGSGKPMREFLYVDDMAEACVFLMENGISDGLFNIGTGEDVTIRELAETVMDVVGFDGTIVYDSAKPDGTPRKLLDVDKMKTLGWSASTGLRDGIARAYADFKERVDGHPGPVAGGNAQHPARRDRLRNRTLTLTAVRPTGYRSQPLCSPQMTCVHQGLPILRNQVSPDAFSCPEGQRNGDTTMKNVILASCALVAASFATAAVAQEGTMSGAAGGAVTGAIVGGPIGAAVGGIAGAALGTAIDPPPPEVVTYVQAQPAPATTVVVERQIEVGQPIPETVVLTPVPDHSNYSYAVVNEQRVIVDPQTGTVVQIIQ